MKKYFGLLIFAGFVFTSCQDNSTSVESLSDSVENKKQEQQVTATISIINADWPGTYSATLPCADCPGIKTELTLLADNTYQLNQVYLEKSQEEIKSNGSFTWMPDSLGIELIGLKEMPNKFLMQNKQLVMLDKDGKAVEGEMANLYILKKNQ